MKFTGTNPIYIQIADYIKKLIDTGVFSKGDAIPSVRDFALSNGVNPNTVARAYDILAQQEVIISIPKKGYFVNDSIDHEHKDLEEIINSLFEKGYTKKQILEILERKEN
mgnify:CR=1 FL=1